MLRTANDVIETFGAPDAARRVKEAIELMRGERFPGMKNGGQLMFTNGCDNGVHMIRHHDKFTELVTFPSKCRRLDSMIALQSERPRMQLP